MDWEAVDVVSEKCGVKPGVCSSIRRLLCEGCTVPFICRYRTAQIEHCSSEVVREVQHAFAEVQRVEETAAKIINTDITMRNELDQIKKGLIRKPLCDVERLKASLIPPQVKEYLKKCKTLAEVTALTDPYKKHTRRTKADIARGYGLGEVAQALINGTGMKFCYWSKLIEVAPCACKEMGADEVAEAILHLTAESIAIDLDTFNELKLLCNQIPPYIRSTRKTTSCSSSETKSSPSQSNDRQTMKPNKIASQFGSGDSRTYEHYFDFRKHAKQIECHQVLAINRGEREGVLSVSVEFSEMLISRFSQWCRTDKFSALKRSEPPTARSSSSEAEQPFLVNLLNNSVNKAWKHFVKPQLSRRIRTEVTKAAQHFAVKLFARNLRSLLLTPPLNFTEQHRNQIVMGIDPGFSHGCKIAILTPNGEKVLHTCVLHLHAGSTACRNFASDHLKSLLEKYNVGVISVGDGVAARETELLLRQLVAEVEEDGVKSRQKRRKNNDGRMCDVDEEIPEVANVLNDLSLASKGPSFVSTREAGVSIWSVSVAAETELPDLSPNLRGAVAIARRLIDPLCEYTKVDPKHLGLGIYQLDLPAAQLEEALSSVVEECVSLVGLQLNHAPLHLLKSISGLGPARSAAIIQYRNTVGRFVSREQLKEVKGIGTKVFQQCAGFLRVQSPNPEIPNDKDIDMKNNCTSSNSTNGMLKLTEEDSYHERRKRKRSPLTGSRRFNIMEESEETSSQVSLSDLSMQHIPSYLACTITPLDNTWIHPENYAAAQRLITASGTLLSFFGTPEFKETIRQFASRLPLNVVVNELQMDEPTFKLIVEGLTSPLGFVDIRESMRGTIFRNGLLRLEDLNPGISLQGRVTNVTSFGAFIDLGIGHSGLLHRRYLSSGDKLDQLIIGQSINVKVMEIDRQRGKPRIALQLEDD